MAPFNVTIVDVANKSDLNNCTLDVLNDYCEPVGDYVDRIYRHLRINFVEGFLILLYIIVFFVGIIGNSLVCFVVLRNRHMRSVTNVFLANLALADFLVLLFCMPPTLVEDIRETWYLGSIPCKITKYLQHVSVTVSILTLTMISVERWYAICRPLKVKATMRRALWIIAVIWGIGLHLGLVPAIDMDTAPFQKLPKGYLLFTECKSTLKGSLLMSFKTFDLLTLFVIPFVWMTVAYAMISYTLWFTNIPGVEVGKRNNSTPEIRTSNENRLRGRRRAALMLIAVVVMFFFCFLPLHIIQIVRYALSQAYFDMYPKFARTLNKLALFSHWFCFFNSAVNPVIYNFMSVKFRREFERAFVCSNEHNRNNRQMGTLRSRIRTHQNVANSTEPAGDLVELKYAQR